jgi:hypothetical protein
LFDIGRAEIEPKSAFIGNATGPAEGSGTDVGRMGPNGENGVLNGGLADEFTKGGRNALDGDALRIPAEFKKSKVSILCGLIFSK